MRKLRVFLAAATMASAFVVASAGPASANCEGDPVNPCVLICSIKPVGKLLSNTCHTW